MEISPGLNREFREEHSKRFLSTQLIQPNLLTLQSTAVTLCNTRFSTQKSKISTFKNFTWCLLCIFCVFVRISRQTGAFVLYRLLSYNRGGDCLLRGTDWVIKTDFLFKGLTASATARCQFENQHKHRGSIQLRETNKRTNRQCDCE